MLHFKDFGDGSVGGCNGGKSRCGVRVFKTSRLDVDHQTFEGHSERARDPYRSSLFLHFIALQKPSFLYLAALALEQVLLPFLGLSKAHGLLVPAVHEVTAALIREHQFASRNENTGSIHD